MKKIFFIFPALIGALFSLYAGEDPFSDLNDAQKLTLSEAYQAVGEHFAQTGEPTRGASYEKTAKMLRTQIVDLSAAAAASVSAQSSVKAAMSTVPNVKKVSENDQKAVGYYFRKLIRAVLSENTDKVLEILNDPFSTWGYFDGLPRDKIEKDLGIIFDSYDLTVYDSTDLYLLDKITYSYVGNNEDSIILTVPTAVSGEGTPLEMLLFWESIQEFSFKRTERSWKLLSIY